MLRLRYDDSQLEDEYILEQQNDEQSSYSKMKMNKTDDDLIHQISTYIEGKSFNELQFILDSQPSNPLALPRITPLIKKAFQNNSQVFSETRIYCLHNCQDNLELVNIFFEIITLGNSFIKIEIISEIPFTSTLFNSFLSYTSKIHLPNLNELKLELQILPYSENQTDQNDYESNLQTLSLHGNNMTILERNINYFQNISTLYLTIETEDNSIGIDLFCLSKLKKLLKLNLFIISQSLSLIVNPIKGIESAKSITQLQIDGDIILKKQKCGLQNLPNLEKLTLNIKNNLPYLFSLQNHLSRLKSLSFLSSQDEFNSEIPEPSNICIEYNKFPQLEEIQRQFEGHQSKENMKKELLSISQLKFPLKNLELQFDGQEINDEILEIITIISLKSFSTANAKIVLEDFEFSFGQELKYSQSLLGCNKLSQFTINQTSFDNQKEYNNKQSFSIRGPIDLLQLTQYDDFSKNKIILQFDPFFQNSFEDLTKGRFKENIEKIQILELPYLEELTDEEINVKELNRLFTFLEILVKLKELKIEFTIPFSFVNRLFKSGIVPDTCKFFSQNLKMEEAQQLKKNLNKIEKFISFSLCLLKQSTLSDKIVSKLSEIQNHQINIHIQKSEKNQCVLFPLARRVFSSNSRLNIEFINQSDSDDDDDDDDNNDDDDDEYHQSEENSREMYQKKQKTKFPVATLMNEYFSTVNIQVLFLQVFLSQIRGIIPLNPQLICVDIYID